jgi:hypothetical protein
MKKYGLLVLLLLMLLCLGFVYLMSTNFKTNERYRHNYHIVCARYKNNVQFLNNAGISYTVVQKGNADGEVPNIANEATSYLYYIIKNYDNLPDNTIFIHDENESWHHDGKLTDKFDEWINHYEDNGLGYFNINKDGLAVTGKNIQKKIINNHFLNEGGKSYWDECMADTFGEINLNLFISGDTKCCAQFILSKDTIHRHKKEFYERIYDWLINKTTSEGKGNENDVYSGYFTGRYLEHTWGIIFLAPIKQ